MKINKIIFACSCNSSSSEKPNEYNGFWNIQSKLWKVGLGIEPVCLLFGKKEKTNMTEEFGKIIEMDIIPDIPLTVQLTWSKFDYPTREPDTTWIMGDIDMLPLQSNHFIRNIEDVPDDHFAHLNAGGNCNNRNTFLEQGSQIHCGFGKSGYPGADLPGHYWVGKGKRFEIFTENKSFLEQVTHISKSYKYGLGAKMGTPIERAKTQSLANVNSYYWCSEEMRSSELMWDAIRNKSVKYSPFFYSSDQRIDRTFWMEDKKDYLYSHENLANKKIVDIHCMRPYEKQKDACEKIIETSKILIK